MTTACTCPSGDGSLRWPCPTHPPVTVVDRPDNGQDEDWVDGGCSCDTPGIVMSEHDERCTLRLCHRCHMVNPDHLPGDDWCRPCTRPHLASGRAGAGEQQRERLIEVMNRHGVPAVGNRAFFAELLAVLGGPQPDGEARQHRMDADCWCRPVQADNGAWDHQ